MSGLFSDIINSEMSKETETEAKPSLFDRQKASFKKDSSLKSLSDTLFGKDHEQDQLIDIPLEAIEVGEQVRKTFDDDEIKELAASINEHGLLQPVTVHKLDGNRYFLICGEKRYRACKYNGAPSIRAVVISQPKNKDEMLALQIIENMHRSTPPVFDIADAFSKLKVNHSVDEMCKFLSCKKTYIYNMLNIFKLTDKEERELFKELNLSFLQKYTDFKSNFLERAKRVFYAIGNEYAKLDDSEKNKEKLQQIANYMLKKAISEKKREQKEEDLQKKLQKVDRSYKNLDLTKNVTFSWKKIDKIRPQTSALLDEYIAEHPLTKPVNVIAEALAEYLSKENSNYEGRRSEGNRTASDESSLG